MSIIFIFPLIVYIGASGSINNRLGKRVCKFFGDISYPIIYTYTAWVKDNDKTFAEAWLFAMVVFVSSVTLALSSMMSQ